MPGGNPMQDSFLYQLMSFAVGMGIESRRHSRASGNPVGARRGILRVLGRRGYAAGSCALFASLLDSRLRGNDQTATVLSANVIQRDDSYAASHIQRHMQEAVTRRVSVS